MSIHPQAQIGTISLTVSNLERSLRYYQHNIGLALHRRADNSAVLGAGGPDLLILTERPSARQVHGTTGLYHFALLVPSRLELAKTVKHLHDSQTPIGGASDHLVSEALYLSDPDGNGIEIYRDRPRDEWQILNDTIQIATQPLDIHDVLGELNGQPFTWEGLHSETRMGHIHLHVSNLEEALAFYTQVLGFDLVTRYGAAAAFVSAGGYHHHIGLNTWAGAGAPPPPADAVGLNWYTILLPDEAALEETAVRLKNTGVYSERKEDGLFLRDPAQNSIVLQTRA